MDSEGLSPVPWSEMLNWGVMVVMCLAVGFLVGLVYWEPRPVPCRPTQVVQDTIWITPLNCTFYNDHNPADPSLRLVVMMCHRRDS